MKEIIEKILGFIIVLVMIGFIAFCFIAFSPFMLIGLIIFIIILIIGGIICIKDWLQQKVFKTHHNCFDCKYYRLHDVASYGDKCWYKCNKLDNIDSHSMNDRAQIRKCKYYEQDDNI